MGKRTVSIVLGLVMIAVGVTGITLHQVNEHRQAALKELELMKEQEQAKVAAAEEQRRAEEERRRAEELAQQVEVEKRKQAEERRQLEENRRRKQVEMARNKPTAEPARIAAQPKPKPPRNIESTSARKEPAPVKKEPRAPRFEPDRQDEYAAEDSWQASIEGSAPRRLAGSYDIDEIRSRAGREAAMLLRRVTYSNTRTGDRVRAEPVGHDPVNVRVRVRIWEEQDLVCDTFMRLSRVSRAY